VKCGLLSKFKAKSPSLERVKGAESAQLSVNHVEIASKRLEPDWGNSRVLGVAARETYRR